MSKKKDPGAAENIKVVMRVRPLSEKEIAAGEEHGILCDIPAASVTIKGVQGRSQFTFDNVINDAFTQADIFTQIIVPMCEAVLSGYNATVFAYGQSGSGKTHTMQGVIGDPLLEGVSPRSFRYICNRVDECAKSGDSSKQYRIKCSFLELYNMKVRDLLSAIPDRDTLQIKESKDKTFYVQDLSEFAASNTTELIRYMEDGISKRKVEATNLNAVSSRSHAVYTVSVELTETLDDGQKRIVTSKLNLVDLAGSERQEKTGATGDRLKEGCNINQSLSALGLVIDALVKAQPHIPFRSSQLTMLLKDSLGGGSKTLMFANVRPSTIHASETLSTLRFADRAKQIKNKPQIQMDAKDLRIKTLEEENERLKAKLKTYEGGEGEDLSAKVTELEEKITILETEAAGMRDEAQRLRDESALAQERAAAKIEEAKLTLDARAQDAEERKMEEKLAAASSATAAEAKELKALVTEFVGAFRHMLNLPPDTALSAASLAEAGGSGVSVDLLAQALDGVRAVASKGLSSTRQEEAIAQARREAAAHAESVFQGMVHEQQARIQDLERENEQARTSVEQALARLVKLKDKADKEREARRAAEAAAAQQLAQCEEGHKTESSALKALVAELEEKLSAAMAGNLRRSSFSMRRSRSQVFAGGSPHHVPAGGGGDGGAGGGGRLDDSTGGGAGAEAVEAAKAELKRLRGEFGAQKKALMAQIEALHASGGALDPKRVEELEVELAAVRAQYQAKIDAAKAQVDECEHSSHHPAGGGDAAAERAAKAQFAAQKRELLARLEEAEKGGASAEEERAALRAQLADLKRNAHAVVVGEPSAAGGDGARPAGGESDASEGRDEAAAADIAAVRLEAERIQRELEVKLGERDAAASQAVAEADRLRDEVSRLREEQETERAEAEKECEALRAKIEAENARAAEAAAKERRTASELARVQVEAAAHKARVEELELKLPELTHCKNEADRLVDEARAASDRAERRLRDKEAELRARDEIVLQQRQALEARKARDAEMVREAEAARREAAAAKSLAKQEVEEASAKIQRAANERIAELVAGHAEEMKNVRAEAAAKVAKAKRRVEKEQAKAAAAMTQRDEEILQVSEYKALLEESKVENMRLQRSGGTSARHTDMVSEGRGAYDDAMRAARSAARRADARDDDPDARAAAVLERGLGGGGGVRAGRPPSARVTSTGAPVSPTGPPGYGLGARSRPTGPGAAAYRDGDIAIPHEARRY